MIQIDGILISEEILEKHFACQLEKCSGACCWEGDYGAPLESGEIETIREEMSVILDQLPDENMAEIKKHGFYRFYKEADLTGTRLFDDGRCVFMGKDERGIAYCAIEKAYFEGKTKFRKPISCHLYPIRVTKNEAMSFEALNYDEWEICRAACKNGANSGVYLYEFLREALIRKYGKEFYAKLESYAKERLG